MPLARLAYGLAVLAVWASAAVVQGQHFDRGGGPATRPPATPTSPPTFGSTAHPPTPIGWYFPGPHPPYGPYPYHLNYHRWGGAYYYPGPVVIPIDDSYIPDASRFPVGDEGLPDRSPADPTVTARRLIGFGNGFFSKQRYGDACDRYHRATEIAPAMAEPCFRQGFAHVAMGQYELAARAMRRGLELDPQWPRANPAVTELYGINMSVKAIHLEALAQAVEKDAANGDLLFLLGLWLTCDGQPDRAALFFGEAERLKLSAK